MQIRINDLKIEIDKPKQIVAEILKMPINIHCWSVEALKNLYIEAHEMTKEIIKDEKGGVFTAFRKKADFKIEKMKRCDYSQGKLVMWIYNEILKGE